jgi:hypothetical protein
MTLEDCVLLWEGGLLDGVCVHQNTSHAMHTHHHATLAAQRSSAPTVPRDGSQQVAISCCAHCATYIGWCKITTQQEMARGAMIRRAQRDSPRVKQLSTPPTTTAGMHAAAAVATSLPLALALTGYVGQARQGAGNHLVVATFSGPPLGQNRPSRQLISVC